jgi:integrase
MILPLTGPAVFPVGADDHVLFLRHLHRSGRTVTDLSGTVIGPRIYDHEDIPSALGPEEVRRVLEVTREDLSPVGLRDYAVLTLLATYGLRAAEIVRLRLEDIDWRRDLLCVRHAAAWPGACHRSTGARAI